MANSLSKTIDKIPSSIVQTVVGIILAGLVSWATWSTALAMNHDTRIAVTETRVDSVKGDIAEIKDGQRELSKKMDRLLERRH